MKTEKKQGHTPGPWGIAEQETSRTAVDINAADGMSVAEGVTSIFDARLIAAAPELLAAAKNLLRTAMVDGPYYDDLRAAIAKAEVK